MQPITIIRFALISLLLTACGGSGGGGETESVNNSASASTSCSPQQTITGTARKDGLRISNVEWLQTVGQSAASATTRLVGDKPALVRVDLLSNSGDLAPTRRELLVSDGSRCRSIPLQGPDRVPTSTNPDNLNTAYIATIPADLMRPNMSMTVVFDDNQGRSAAEAAQTRSTITPQVSAPINERLYIIPLQHREERGYVDSPGQLASLLEEMLPVSNVNLEVRPVFAAPSLQTAGGGGLLGGVLSGGGGSGKTRSDFNTMVRVLNEVDELCATLPGRSNNAANSAKCLGVFPDNIEFTGSVLTPNSRIVGVAQIGGTAMLAESVSIIDVPTVQSPYDSNHWLAFRAVTVVHEYGHLLNLDHAACGVSGRTDSRLYNDGRLGGRAGFDSRRGFYFNSMRPNNTGRLQFADLMSYCLKEWTSDRGYRAMLAYRTGSVNASRVAESAASRWLKLSPTLQGWQVRVVDFAPDTLVPADETLMVRSLLGIEQLAVYRSVLSDAPDQLWAPRYVELGEWSLLEMSLSVGGVQLQQWLTGTLESLFTTDKP
ncbi:MAG: hypothetical protein Q8L72_02120 [Moraxellaceae bacterium]|nr:hypothetical protein [Moraxellaceae bacterium]